MSQMVTKKQLQKLCFDSKGIRGFGGKLTVGLTSLWQLFIKQAKVREQRCSSTANPSLSLSLSLSDKIEIKAKIFHYIKSLGLCYFHLEL